MTNLCLRTSNWPSPNTSQGTLRTVWLPLEGRSKHSLNVASPKITSKEPQINTWFNADASYSGELLLDQQRYEDAVEKFDRAVELEKLKSVTLIHILFRNTDHAILQDPSQRSALGQ